MSENKPRILVADDQQDVIRALRMLLDDAGYLVTAASSPAEALKHLGDESHDLMLMDLNYARDTTSGEEGIALLREVRERDPHLPLVVMTAYASIDLAVEVTREGARDFIEKPWDNHRLLNVIRAQLELSRSRRRERGLEQSLRAIAGTDGVSLVAESAAMRDVLDIVRRVGDSDATVLITGENGVGKGVIAAALHAVSPRAEQPMLVVDMGTLSGGLVEAELFGHERGAFTDARGERVGRFEIADGGTLLLDEVGNCPLDQQAKLLRVIESGQFERLGSSRPRHTDVRVLCATNADLPQEVAEGRFRRDLLYRINTVEIRIPPLRDRPEDIEPLAHHFLRRFESKYRRDIAGFSEKALAAMARYPWPGNVRELAHSVERGVLLGKGDRLDVADLELRPDPAPGDGVSWDGLTLEEIERRAIARALERHGGNVKEAAKVLGVSRSALYRRLERYGIAPSGGDP